MFLYERVLILCKKQENTGDYNFKFEFELDGLKIEDDKSKQNRFRSGWKFFENFAKKKSLCPEFLAKKCKMREIRYWQKKWQNTSCDILKPILVFDRKKDDFYQSFYFLKNQKWIGFEK